MSGFEILTITFSFIVGLGVAQVLRSVAYVVRENKQLSLHWIPFSVAAMILFFQVQFWFGLSVINTLMEQWSWPVYALMLLLAIFIFLSGATVLPHSLTSLGGRGLKEDFDTRGRISLVFLALYLVGWIGVGIVFWKPEFWHLVLVNGLFALVALDDSNISYNQNKMKTSVEFLKSYFGSGFLHRIRSRPTCNYKFISPAA